MGGGAGEDGGCAAVEGPGVVVDVGSAAADCTSDRGGFGDTTYLPATMLGALAQTCLRGSRAEAAAGFVSLRARRK